MADKTSKKNFMNNIMDDIFHRDNPICQIIPTTSHPREKDAFKMLRPKHGTCLDYTISQTDARFDAGDTKIHLQQTVAEYVPSGKNPRPERTKKTRYFSGGPPQWVFIDEIWRKKVEAKQKMYHQQFAERVQARKNKGKNHILSEHRRMLRLVGPEWFQELSPPQLANVDSLKKCILKDIAEGSIVNTTENIAYLGLVLRPNHRWIEKALKNCCKCPVEFLLNLYQLINPNRKRYSINDRLLLSAVVHLTMKDTLRELHVRIPSPPRPPKSEVIKSERKRRIHYESPYLEPYTFKRPPPQFTGVYTNKHRQYPESPYFSYLEEFRKAGQSKVKGTIIDINSEIEEETAHAQQIYEALVDFRPVPFLMKPSLYPQCIHIKSKKQGSKELTDYEKILVYLKSFEQEEEENEEQEQEEEEGEEENYVCCCRNASQNCNEEEIKKATTCKDTEKIPEQKCNCAEQKEEEKEVIKPSALKRAVCECKADSRKFIDQPLCQCEQCIEDRKNKTTTPVIDRMKEIEDEEVIPIVDAIIAEQPCKCLKHYTKKVDEYELYQKRKDLVYDTVKEKEKFIVGGVVNRPEGPVFMFTNLMPKNECICNEIARDEEAERQHLARMPHPPPGRIQYGIQGVRETPDGNVFVLNETLPSQPCECMKIYEDFTCEHYKCLEMYEMYMNQMKDEMENFFNEPTQVRGKTNKYYQSEDTDVNVYDMNMNKIQEESNRIRPPIEGEVNTEELESEVGDVTVNQESDVEPNELNRVCRHICGKKHKTVPTCCCGCGRPLVTPCKNCTCGVKISCIDCTCGPPSVEEIEEEVEEEEKIELKRFFIFDKILCNKEWQMDVIKKALDSMAEDGFPLAKLPDCHKLPHFKLWMQMRCGKYWTQKDRYNSVIKSKTMWRHLDFCHVRSAKFPQLPITRHEASLINWSQACYCRSLVQDALIKFYRKLRQNQVNFGREYFPSFFDYQFPFRTFRDCNFAYTPAKEEDVIARFVWKKFEYKQMADVKH